jgi:transcriptional regulator with XRE-family HTH domain
MECKDYPILARKSTYFFGMEENTNPFGSNLRRIRLERGLTQAELGNKVGLSKRMIVHYEKHIKRPPGDKLILLSKALGVASDVLLCGNNATEQGHHTDPLFARKLERAKRLPESDRELLASMIDTMIKKNDMQVKRPRKNKTSKPKS